MNDKHAEHRHHGHDLVNVLVNEKTVLMPKIELTGYEIKELAIAEGVPIKLDFVLFLEHSNGRQETVKDDDRVQIRAHQRFEAIDNDDNS
jgi:hypothetical protein